MDYKNFIKQISFVADAHQEHSLPTAHAFRPFPSGEKNPYFTHSLWCAMMILLDTRLPEKIRIPGHQALLFHDILEDTSMVLPEDVSEEVRALVKEMTFEGGFAEEKDIVLTRPPMTQLLKLYDKTATLYDECTPKGDKLQEWLIFMKSLIQNVEKEYGELNIVLVAEAMIAKFQNIKPEKK